MMRSFNTLFTVYYVCVIFKFDSFPFPKSTNYPWVQQLGWKVVETIATWSIHTHQQCVVPKNPHIQVYSPLKGTVNFWW